MGSLKNIAIKSRYKNPLISFFGFWNWNLRLNAELLLPVERCSINEDLNYGNLIRGDTHMASTLMRGGGGGKMNFYQMREVGS